MGRKTTLKARLQKLIRVALLLASYITSAVGFAQATTQSRPSGIFVRSTVTASTSMGGGSSLTLKRPAGMVAGDFLVAQLAVRGGTGTKLTSPSGWSLIRQDTYGGSITQAIYGKTIINPSAEPAQYTWYFNSRNGAAARIADYAGIDAVVTSSGRASASSNYVVAPSVQIPNGSAAVTVIGFFGITSGEPVLPPAKMTQHWSFTGWGIGVGMGDLTMAPGQPTGNQNGTARQAASNTGALVVLSAATYYVSPTGNDFNNGTSQISAWATIQHAANVMQPGNTTIVLAGIYNERVSVTTSGQNGKPITFQVLAGATATMQGFEVNANYIRILGFNITNHNQTDETAWGIYLIGSNNTVIGNNIHDLCAEGIYVSGNGDPNSDGTANNIIVYNSFIRDEMAGGQIEGQTNLVAYNTVSGTLQYSPNCYSRDGADADGFRFFGNGHVFRSNTLENIPVPGSQYNPNPHTDCFQTWGPATNMTFDSNWCQWPVPANVGGGATNEIGMVENSAGTVSNLLFTNNVFVDMYQGLLVDGSGGSSNIIGLRFYNNTVDNISEEGVILIADVPAAQVINSIFCDVGAGGDNYLSADSSSSNFTAADNDMWMSNNSAPGTYGSKATYINKNPQFVNLKGLNFRLSTSSPMIGRGESLSQVTHDYDGIARPRGAAYDIGAFEHH
jgi:hypothetical protein